MSNWIKISDESDLPDQSCDVFFKPKRHTEVVLGHFYIGQFGDYYFGDGHTAISAEMVSHYMPIIFPALPPDE